MPPEQCLTISKYCYMVIEQYSTAAQQVVPADAATAAANRAGFGVASFILRASVGLISPPRR